MTEKKKTIIITHASYGCDTGCCGHVIEIRGYGENIDGDEFEFTHPYIPYGQPKGEPELRAWAEEWVREMGCDPVDLDWESCVILDD